MASATSLSPPKDLTYHLSKVTQARTPSNIKKFYKYFTIPGIGNLAGGLPNNNYFPFDTLEGSAALPDRFKPTPNKPIELLTALGSSLSATAKPTAAQVVVPKVAETQDLLRKIDLKTALQYGTAQGYPPLYAFLRQFTRENLHPSVPYKDGPEIILTCGSTDGMAKSIEAFTNVWTEGLHPVGERQGLICEEFAYTNALGAVRPRGMNIVTVVVDDEGMVAKGPGGLEDVLSSWDYTRGKRPHLIYTVTIGQNPTSGTLGVARRKEIYALCVEYDLLIIEDDPYWYLQYPSASALSAAARGTPPPSASSASLPGALNYNAPTSSGFPFLDSLVPSYLSVDTEGRVIRLDTFSKTVAPGCRLGWITGQPDLVAKILSITETSTQQPSGFVQSVIAQLIMGPDASIPPAVSGGGNKGGEQDGWKVAGWVRWLEGLRGNYERRMNTMCSILEEGRFEVKTGRRPSLTDALASASPDGGMDDGDDEWRVVSKVPMYDFAWPRGGMFVWIELMLESHPLCKKVGAETLAQALWVFLTMKPHLVLVSPGTSFSPTQEIAETRGWRFFRICFAAVDEEDVRKTSERFVEGVRAFWRRKDLDGIEEMAGMGKEMAAMGPVGGPGFC